MERQTRQNYLAQKYVTKILNTCVQYVGHFVTFIFILNVKRTNVADRKIKALTLLNLFDCEVIFIAARKLLKWLAFAAPQTLQERQWFSMMQVPKMMNWKHLFWGHKWWSRCEDPSQNHCAAGLASTTRNWLRTNALPWQEVWVCGWCCYTSWFHLVIVSIQLAIVFWLTTYWSMTIWNQEMQQHQIQRFAFLVVMVVFVAFVSLLPHV